MDPVTPEADSLIGLLDLLVVPDPPPPVSMRPETWGWAVLAALLALALLWGLWRLWRRWQADAYRRGALRLLAAAGDDPARIAEILRRTALSAYPRDRVAGLAGAEWLAFLTASGGRFGPAEARSLLAGPWRPMPPDAALSRAAAHWVRDHRRAGR